MQVLESEGLQRYVDPRYLRQELSEATGLTVDEMDEAAHRIMLQRRDRIQGLGVPQQQQRPQQQQPPPPQLQAGLRHAPYDGDEYGGGSQQQLYRRTPQR